MIELFDFSKCAQMEAQEYDALVQRLFGQARMLGFLRPVEGAPYDDGGEQDVFAAPALKAVM